MRAIFSQLQFRILLFFLWLLFCPACGLAQTDELSRSWNQPVKPFRIAGNLYYVGASDLSSFLIVTPQGHILLDSGLVETVPQIQKNVAQLGFRLEDVKVLINSHAHYDHAGGLAELGVRLAEALHRDRGDRGDHGEPAQKWGGEGMRQRRFLRKLRKHVDRPLAT